MADTSGNGAHARRKTQAWAAIAAQASAGNGVANSLQCLCLALTSELAAMGATVSLMSQSGSEGVIAGSDGRVVAIDELQFTRGDGPCHDVFTSRRPVLTADVNTASQWPGFAPAAARAGVGAVFAFPLGVGAAIMGVLSVYADHAGSLSDEQTALVYGQIATDILLDAHQETPDGWLDAGVRSALNYRAEVYQAQGMVMVDLGVSLEVALARMRAHAFVTDQDLVELAYDIIAGRTQLQKDPN